MKEQNDIHKNDEKQINDLRMRLSTFDYPNFTPEQTSWLIQEALESITLISQQRKEAYNEAIDEAIKALPPQNDHVVRLDYKVDAIFSLTNLKK